ncbi:uncharacterized protein LOC106060577 [Biomphalaria glabrata]|uniref:Uncharacterized protein LOC106060577 n=1 Tax=Biomphalaria glabrata TaxID=6526 RepID=A0A9W2YRG3_BIOGL|nr:uncharacterized protein LOC106060577 [Biomphalaria glabrata]
MFVYCYMRSLNTIIVSTMFRKFGCLSVFSRRLKRLLFGLLYVSIVISFVCLTSLVPPKIAVPKFSQSLLSENYNSHNRRTQATDYNIHILTQLLQERLKEVSSAEKTGHSPVCETNASIGDSCLTTGCYRLKMPTALRDRIEQIVSPEYMRLSLPSKKLLEMMAANVSGSFNVTIISALSSNHFMEAQGLIYKVHQHLLPYLINFTFIIYNLGLSSEERSFIAQICKCHLIDFPFQIFSRFVSLLHCYTWKALIVNAHITKTNVLIWADTSVRFLQDPQSIRNIFSQVKTRGIQLGKGKKIVAHNTLASMFHYFQDEPCMYLKYNEAMSGMIVVNNDLLVRQAILEPWAACALNGSCMCPTERSDLHHIVKASTCRTRKSLYQYGVCHRFDQSAISILIAKLYQEHYNHVVRNYSEFWAIDRNDRTPYPGLTFRADRKN